MDLHVCKISFIISKANLLRFLGFLSTWSQRKAAHTFSLLLYCGSSKIKSFLSIFMTSLVVNVFDFIVLSSTKVNGILQLVIRLFLTAFVLISRSSWWAGSWYQPAQVFKMERSFLCDPLYALILFSSARTWKHQTHFFCSIGAQGTTFTVLARYNALSAFTALERWRLAKLDTHTGDGCAGRWSFWNLMKSV